MNSEIYAAVNNMLAAGCDSELVKQLQELLERLSVLEAAMRPWAEEAQVIAARLEPMSQEATALAAKLEPLVNAVWKTAKQPKRGA